MTITRVGTNEKYAAGWAAIFGGSKSKSGAVKSAAGKGGSTKKAVKKAVKKAAAAPVAKKATKKVATKKVAKKAAKKK